MVNWNTCPLCQASPLEVKIEETLLAYNHLSLTVGEGGALASAQWGTTDPDWESSETQDFLCAVCEQPLPRNYQDELSEAL